MSSRSNSDLSYPSSSPNSGSENETANSGRRRGKRNRPVYFSDERRRKSGRIRKPAVDLVSALPDSLLVHVLSFLPIVYAVRTQVLSKRWQYLWTYTTSLVFRIDDGNSPGNGKSDDEFVAFVDKTLSLCNCSKIKKFGVQFVYEPEYLSNVDLWTEFVTAKGVEEFQLDFDCALGEVKYSDYWLPQLLYTNSSFKVLQFNQCYVMPEGVVFWNSLKKLSIGNAVLSEDLIQNILAGSPVLEILELYCVFGFNRLHVSNASMKKLILRDICEEGIVPEEYQIFNFADYSVLEISAPHLHSLEISGAFENKICQLGDVSSLVDAKLNFDVTGYEDYCDIIEVFENMLKGLLQSLVHGKKITLGNWAIKYFPDQLCKFDGKNYWTSRKKPFTCLMFRLQKVRFLGFRRYEVGNKLGYYLSFVRFLLKNARVLQKMVINAEMVGCNSQKEFSRVAQKLLSFPRSSPDAVVMFYE